MNSSIYFDNAATTPLHKEVVDAMMPYLMDFYGNPSSTYGVGRVTKIAIETARKTIAQLLNTTPSAIYFTSGGTESNNTAIACSIRDLTCTHIITSPIEHHAVLHTIEHYSKHYNVPRTFVRLTANGEVDYLDLETQLGNLKENGKKCFVSLMHANNEIGNLMDISRVGSICKQYGAVFHSDCVQTVGHYPINLKEIAVDFISGASHKFHGPKGVGMLYVNPELKINPLIYGGGQERNLRAGTENVYGIVGFSKALEMAMQNYQKDNLYISELKAYFKARLEESIPRVQFNGAEQALYTVLSVCFPKSRHNESLLIKLDIENICVSGGSACSSDGKGSHVINVLGNANDCTTIRFSFSKYNTIAEVDTVIEVLKSILLVEESDKATV